MQISMGVFPEARGGGNHCIGKKQDIDVSLSGEREGRGQDSFLRNGGRHEFRTPGLTSAPPALPQGPPLRPGMRDGLRSWQCSPVICQDALISGSLVHWRDLISGTT